MELVNVFKIWFLDKLWGYLKKKVLVGLGERKYICIKLEMIKS